MKNVTKYIALGLIAVSLTGCQRDFLEEEQYGLILPSDYFKTQDDLEKGVNGLYDFVGSTFREVGTLAACMGSDDVTTIPGGNKLGFREFDVFAAKDNNDRLPMLWEPCWATIKQANIIFSVIDSITSPTTNLETAKDYALGQAHFLRGMSYFWLTQTWGGVPLITGLDFDYEIAPADPSEVYDLIISDFQAAEQLLPATSGDWLTDHEQQTAYARPTQGAAKAFLAKAYLWRAGYPVKDASAYALAAAKAKEVIDNAGTYGYALESSHDDLWFTDNNKSEEYVFGLHYNAEYVNTWWHWSATQQLSPKAFLPEEAGGWNDLFAELAFFEKFPAGPRKDATFLTSLKKDPFTPASKWQDWASGHPHYKKWIWVPGFDWDAMGTDLGWYCSKTIPVMRYAEVLLIYAEAQAMAGGVTAAAEDALNEVRDRAGLGDLTGLSTEAFVDSVIAERAWEFAGNEPAARWYDLVRKEMVEEVTADRDPAEIPLVNQPSKSVYFAPFPQQDKILNPNLVQE